MTDTVAVTGAEGFIGSHLVEALVRRGHRVRGMVLYNMICKDQNAAREWLEQSIEQRDLMTIIQIRSPLAALMRACARWPALARQINLPDQVS